MVVICALLSPAVILRTCVRTMKPGRCYRRHTIAIASPMEAMWARGCAFVRTDWLGGTFLRCDERGVNDMRKNDLLGRRSPVGQHAVLSDCLCLLPVPSHASRRPAWLGHRGTGAKTGGTAADAAQHNISSREGPQLVAEGAVKPEQCGRATVQRRAAPCS